MAYSQSWVNSTPADPCVVTVSPTANDVLIAYQISDATGAAGAAPTGFSGTALVDITSTFDNSRLTVWIKQQATGSETSVSLNGASNAIIGGVLAFSGIDNTTSLDVAAQSFADSVSGTTASASLTPVTNGCDIVAILDADTGSVDSTFSFSTTSGTTGAWTGRTDQNSGFYNVGSGTATQTTAGAITVQGTQSNAGGRLFALIALRPATNALNATPGAWAWAGSAASLTGLPDTAFQQNAFQSNAFQIFGGTIGGGGATVVNAAPGAWSWAGSTATFPVPQVSVTPGAWTWAGSTQAFTQLINATPGTWSWAGSTQATTQLINQVTGAWSWAGSTQALTQLLNATPGTWTWAGSTQTTTQLINAAVGAWTWAGSTQTITAGLVEVNATPGTWTWVGSTATFPSGATTIDTTPGTWSWAGSTATIPTQLSAITGTWTWAGSQSATTQLLNATPGAFTWAGSTATTSQVFNATPGLWSWAGSVQGIVSQVTIDATPGNWTWAGSQATITTGEVAFDYHDGGKEKKRRKREQERIEEERLRREKLRAQIEGLVSPPEPVEPAPVQETPQQVFKESEKTVILPPLPEVDEDEEDILRLLMSYYEIPRRILP